MISLNRQSLFRTRINENLLKVSEESSDVKSLLSLGVLSSKSGKNKRGKNLSQCVIDELNASMYKNHIKRKDLLRTCILLGTSRNTKAQQNLIEIISKRLGEIHEDDYKFIAKLIYLNDDEVVSKVNKFLCSHIIGYQALHHKFYNDYYGF